MKKLQNDIHNPLFCKASPPIIIHLKALILGGSATTAGTLTWAISLLLNNPHAMKKAQEELDLHVGTERQVEESDITNLVYLQAIIKETLRLYPAGPLLGPREALEDCTVAGYRVPAGTRHPASGQCVEDSKGSKGLGEPICFCS